ncbi:hypothetical protein PT447_00100 [Aliarcobacter butzleri]|uniref:hypothetical protein n=1 Tax=Aliarcobacter butzleri TaxID=28197 RepID=UPI0024DEBA32|nr:hypothetical protein [Aliarcobacter butzleri]MDK2063320.1 hypothetical protein [Aliarcobacter butzleri]
MKKGQYGARKNNFDVNKFDENKIELLSFMIQDNHILRKTNEDMQTLLKDLNIYKNTPILEYLLRNNIVEIKDIDFNDINYIKKLTITYLNFLKTNLFSKNGTTQIAGTGHIFNFDKDFNKLKIEENEIKELFKLFKNVNYKEFIEETNDSFLDLIYLMIFLYNYSETNNVIDFSDVLKEFNNTSKEIGSYLDFHDFKDEETFEGIFYNFIPLYKFYIDDFQTYIIKSKTKITENNLEKVFKDFKNIATKSIKIKNRNEYQLENNLNKSDYYRVVVLNQFKFNK